MAEMSARQQELGEELRPSGSQADAALSSTLSEPGGLRSFIRPLGFVAVAMAMT